jgi:coproporphyrinogen III oxidase
MDQHTIAEGFRTLQDDICSSLEAFDQKGVFREDHWKRPGGGGGRTRIMAGANLLEKGGVNFSAVEGELPERIGRALGLEPGPFFASGVSIVLHPHSPMVPIIHANVRYFEAGGTWWFGGGIDLTPHYVVPEDAVAFHRGLKAVCDRHDPAYYPRFKTWADDYFYIRHRRETRGVGGIFFDRLGPDEGHALAQRHAFTMDVGRAFFPLYRQAAEPHRDEAWGQKEKDWQLHRRGRYVEFNLVYDKGTKFGLDTDGRIESILMSLPQTACWTYEHRPENDPRAAETLGWLRKGIDWAAGVPAAAGA